MTVMFKNRNGVDKCMYQLSHLIKQKNLDMPLVESIVKTLYYGTGLSATVLDHHNDRVFGQGPVSSVDELFEDIFDNFDAFSKTICTKQGNGIYTYESSYELSYLAAIIADQHQYYGAILLGPFLSKEADEHLINEVMNTRNFSMTKRDHLKNMYDVMPILNTSRNYYIQQLLATAITNPVLNKLYPHSQSEDLTEDMINTYIPDIISEKSDHNYALEILFLTKVQNGDLEKVIDLYNEHIKAQYFNQITSNHIRQSKNNAFSFSTLMARAIIAGGVEPEKSLSFEAYYRNKIESTHSIEELIAIIERMVIKYTNSVLQLSNINHVSVIKNASKYVHMHLSEPIRLNDVANFVNLSPNYFSSLFKREMKISFADYVNQARIKESQYLLETTNYSILDIAVSVGYNNQNYFTTIFRKFTDITPKQYRMRSTK